MTKTAAWVWIGLALGACTGAHVARLVPGDRATVRPGEVRLYREADSIPGSFVEVAVVEGSGPAGGNIGELYVDMIQEAAGVGANGLLWMNMSQPETGERIAAGIMGVPLRRSGQMRAVLVDAPLIRRLGFEDDELEVIQAAEEQAATQPRPAPPIRGMRFVGVRSRMVTYWISEECRAWHDAEPSGLEFFSRAESGTLVGYRLSFRSECQGPPGG